MDTKSSMQFIIRVAIVEEAKEEEWVFDTDRIERHISLGDDGWKNVYEEGWIWVYILPLYINKRNERFLNELWNDGGYTEVEVTVAIGGCSCRGGGSFDHRDTNGVK